MRAAGAVGAGLPEERGVLVVNAAPASLAALTRDLPPSRRILRLKERMLAEPRFLTIEQALLITESYRENEGQPRVLQRARALAKALQEITIQIDPEELIVGNRSPGVRAGVVSPEAGIAWVERELETLPHRRQDAFQVRAEDAAAFRQRILPYWQGRTLEDAVERQLGRELRQIGKVAKINQTDHAQGHICPDCRRWLREGPAGLQREAAFRLEQTADPQRRLFYEAVVTVLAAARVFLRRYGALARCLAEQSAEEEAGRNLGEISRTCERLADHPAETFREALQSVWFLFVILELESNASSFSPGRMDQILYPYLMRDLQAQRLSLEEALELLEAFWLKFNQIVYLRNADSARYFAGFPIGFNICIGGQDAEGGDAVNLLSFLCLQAQRHVGLPQPNFSVRLHGRSSDAFLEECCRVIGLGSGMPQIFNDESIIPALESQGIAAADALDYAVVGCVELSTQGSELGWSDAAMFNLVKALELTLNNGVCLLTGQAIGLPTGHLWDYHSFEDLEEAFARQLRHFIERMIPACDLVERLHAEFLPSPLLSSVVADCLQKGLDVTAGGARYNLSGIQAIQVANLADSLAALKQAVFDEKSVEPRLLLEALRSNFEGHEPLRQWLLNRVPKYGNDVEWVDLLGRKWIEFFNKELKRWRNARGGPYHVGLYTVSAHVPMGKNVGASPDGRKAGQPLADGGLSAMYGRDQAGPTAVLHSVARVDSLLASNGTLLNLKFLPEFFRSEGGIRRFAAFLRGLVRLKIHHVQFNVIRREDLLAAKKNPEEYRSLVVRVAGYTAYFTELADDLQDEIIARTSHGGAGR